MVLSHFDAARSSSNKHPDVTVEQCVLMQAAGQQESIKMSAGRLLAARGFANGDLATLKSFESC